MINHPEGLWNEAKKTYFPTAGGEDEKKLRLLFMQAMFAGMELTRQGLNLPDHTAVQFFNDLRGQLIAALRELGHNPVKITIGTLQKPTIKARINGEEIP